MSGITMSLAQIVRQILRVSLWFFTLYVPLFLSLLEEKSQALAEALDMVQAPASGLGMGIGDLRETDVLIRRIRPQSSAYKVTLAGRFAEFNRMANLALRSAVFPGNLNHHVTGFQLRVFCGLCNC